MSDEQLSDEERKEMESLKARYAFRTSAKRHPELDGAIWLAGKAFGMEAAAKICDEYVVGADDPVSQSKARAVNVVAAAIRSRIKGAD
jgi:hypothetical protein